jgi:hypothetical protein
MSNSLALSASTFMRVARTAARAEVVRCNGAGEGDAVAQRAVYAVGEAARQRNAGRHGQRRQQQNGHQRRHAHAGRAHPAFGGRFGGPRAQGV